MKQYVTRNFFLTGTTPKVKDFRHKQNHYVIIIEIPAINNYVNLFFCLESKITY